MCKFCKGTGYVMDVRYAGVSHKKTNVRRVCQCRKIIEAPPALDDRKGDPDVLAWMLEWMNE